MLPKRYMNIDNLIFIMLHYLLRTLRQHNTQRRELSGRTSSPSVPVTNTDRQMDKSRIIVFLLYRSSSNLPKHEQRRTLLKVRLWLLAISAAPREFLKPFTALDQRPTLDLRETGLIELFPDQIP